MGAVLVRDRTIISTGFNGSISGAPHCDDVGCMLENDHCVATIHAEVNAILQAAKNGVSTAYTTIYVTANPCLACYRVLVNAGIKNIYYKELYREVDYKSVGLNINTTPDMIHLGAESK